MKRDEYIYTIILNYNILVRQKKNFMNAMINKELRNIPF